MASILFALNFKLQLLAEGWPLFFPICLIIAGGVVGSLFNCLLYRLPNGLPVRYPPSACPSCKTVLKWQDLIPVLSFTFLLGRCRYCKTHIGIKSVLIELLTIGEALCLYATLGPQIITCISVICLWFATFFLLFPRKKRSSKK